MRGAANGAPFSPGTSAKTGRPVFALLSTADGIVGGVARAVFSVMRRQDGGSPCGGHRATACRCSFLPNPLKESANIISQLAAFVIEKDGFLEDKGGKTLWRPYRTEPTALRN